MQFSETVAHPAEYLPQPVEEIPITWRNVASSNVRRVGWFKPIGAWPRGMVVQYHSGVHYAYFDVSRQRAVACAYYPSVGGYINKRVKPHFKCRRIDP